VIPCQHQPDLFGDPGPRIPQRGRPWAFFLGTLRPCVGKLRGWAADHTGEVFRRVGGLWYRAPQMLDSSGYFIVPRPGGGAAMAHVIVAAAFLEERPAGHEVRHGPMGLAVNEPSNLSYGTRRENQLDRHRDGTMPAKLTANDVVIALHCYHHGESFSLIGRRLGVSPGAVRAVISGRTWGHVECAAPRHPELLKPRQKRRREKGSQRAKRHATKVTATTTH